MKKTYERILLVLIILTGSITFGYSQNKNAQKPAAKVVITKLNQAEFKKLIFDFTKDKSEWIYKGSLPAIVDFYADWCGPCKKLSPILEEIASQYKGKLLVYKVDVDAQKELANVFGVQSIPSVLLIPKKGKPFMTQGFMGKEQLEKTIKEKLFAK